jgi:hypothetical protein
MFRYRLLSLVALAALIVGAARPASAIPLLQLEVTNGVYDTVDEDTVATTNAFTMYAYLTPPNNASVADINKLLAQTFYISAAISPKVSATNPNLGSFSFNGTTVNATSDMTYGTPPMPATFSSDIPSHGIYETYFKEFSFKFLAANKSAAYDVQTATQFDAPQPVLPGNKEMYYAAFTVDISALNPTKQLHFDLYTVSTDKKGTKYLEKAPFSHDASSGMHAPEPGTWVMLGTGLAAIAAQIRRRRKS